MRTLRPLACLLLLLGFIAATQGLCSDYNPCHYHAACADTEFGESCTCRDTYSGNGYTCQADQQMDLEDADALFTFYYGLSDKGSLNWQGNLCDVPEVLCDGAHVRHLAIQSTLVGTLASDLARLSKLQTMTFRTPSLTGTIPTEFGMLQNLVILDFERAQLKGGIPKELSNAKMLSQIVFLECGLTGSIPSELGTLPQLIHLELPNNQLTGTIPTELPKIFLNYLYLSGNRLTGTVPTQIGASTFMKGVDLHSNQLSGVIPFQLGYLQRLVYLDLASNSFTGVFPPSIALSAVNLTVIDLSKNKLTGSVSSLIENLSTLSRLQYLNLGINSFTGTIPPSLGNLQQLRKLYLEGLGLTGNIPNEVGGLVNLQTLSFAYNSLEGEIPYWLTSFPLEHLSLANNSFWGNPFSVISQLTSLKTAYLFNNQFYGTLQDVPASLKKLRLNGNGFWGTIPASYGSQGFEELFLASTGICPMAAYSSYSYQSDYDYYSAITCDSCKYDTLYCQSPATCYGIAQSPECRCPSGYELDGVQCQDINECNSNVCDYGADCQNTMGSYTCHCQYPGQIYSNQCSCPGNQIVRDGTCKCRFDSMERDGDYCRCPPGSHESPSDGCICNEGMAMINGKCSCVKPGQVFDHSYGECRCPDGQTYDVFTEKCLCGFDGYITNGEPINGVCCQYYEKYNLEAEKCFYNSCGGCPQTSCQANYEAEAYQCQCISALQLSCYYYYFYSDYFITPVSAVGGAFGGLFLLVTLGLVIHHAYRNSQARAEKERQVISAWVPLQVMYVAWSIMELFLTFISNINLSRWTYYSLPVYYWAATMTFFGAHFALVVIFTVFWVYHLRERTPQSLVGIAYFTAFSIPSGAAPSMFYLSNQLVQPAAELPVFKQIILLVAHVLKIAFSLACLITRTHILRYLSMQSTPVLRFLVASSAVALVSSLLFLAFSEEARWLMRKLRPQGSPGQTVELTSTSSVAVHQIPS